MLENFALPKYGHRPIAEIGSDEWSDFKHGLIKNGMGKARANRVHTAVSATYKMAWRLGYVSFNPLSCIGYLKEDLHNFDYWSEAELQHFLGWCFQTQNPRYHFYHFAYETGARVSETMALKEDCVNLEIGALVIRRAFCRVTRQVRLTTKSGRQRVLGISAGLRGTLQRLLTGNPDGFVFRHADEAIFSYEWLKQRFMEDQLAAGSRVIGLHTCLRSI